MEGRFTLCCDDRDTADKCVGALRGESPAEGVAAYFLCRDVPWISPERKASSSHNVYRHLRLMQLSLALAGEYQRQSLMQSFTPKFIRYAEQNKPL
ncbi:MAG: hypothetical protein IIY06_01890 [Proteobacteria bacterium]|nr:hypothetical protein [Pseudomonadota bacterium]